VGNPKNKTNKIEIKHITITQPGKLRLDPAEEDTQRKLSTEHESTSCRTLKIYCWIIYQLLAHEDR
jgi:hypothetical protein